MGKLLDEAASNVTHLRAAFFFDNYLNQLDRIRGAGRAATGSRRWFKHPYDAFGFARNVIGPALGAANAA